jgi:hydroxyacylglutathione hydrolase
MLLLWLTLATRGQCSSVLAAGAFVAEQHSRHPPPRRSPGWGGGLLAYYPAEVFGPAAESITGISNALYVTATTVADCVLRRADFQVIAVPGHTLGHIAYYGAGCLFCGDTLFGGGCGRLFEGSPEQMLGFAGPPQRYLPDDTVVYCAHEYTQENLRFALAVEPGNGRLQSRVREVARARARACSTVPSTIGLEKASNPFLRCSEPEVAAAARRRVPAAADEVAVFAALREWKNTF